jgi:hypothetical protein
MTAPPPDVSAPRRGRPPARNEILRGDLLGGLDPADLAARYGTPLHVYDLDVIERQVETLRAALPPIVEIAYAVKANPALAIVAHLGSLGLGADVASGGELATARRAGIPADRIVVTGPGKRDAELRDAVAAGVRAITVESPGELERLAEIASAAGRRVPVLLRASVGTAQGLERVRLVGDDGAGKFGMDEPDLRAAARSAARSPHLELLGIHRFGASNVLDASRLAAHVAETVQLARSVAGHAGVELRLVDSPRAGLRRLACATSGCSWSRAAGSSERPGPTSPGWSTASASASRRSPSSTAASTTSSGRPWSGRSTGCGSSVRARGPLGRGRSRSPGRSARGWTSSPRTLGCPCRPSATWWRCSTPARTGSPSRCRSS